MDLKLEKEIRAPQNVCYDAFTLPENLSKWFTTNAKADLRVGGRYSNDDNDEGEFLEVKPNELLRFTWDNKAHCPGTEVKVEFKALDKNKTNITLNHSGLVDEIHLSDMKSGWSWALESVKQYLETGKILTYDEWEKNLSNE